uniref:Profilin n=1 Tax=Mola mola TaxID=94237 RepID=A0A3Q3WID6_MOLML
MSWEAYIDSLKGPDSSGTCPVEEAAIWGNNPMSVWATTPGLSTITLEEIKMLCGDRKSFQMCGPSIGGKKCFVLKDEMDEDGMHVLNLKTTKDNDGNAYLISVGKAKTCLIIARGTKDAKGGQVCNKVQSITNYLWNSGM